MGQIISLVNQKGGVGKTTSSVNLSSALALKDYKCLVIDMDPQGNASRALNSKAWMLLVFTEVLSGKVAVQESVQKSDLDNLFLISSQRSFSRF